MSRNESIWAGAGFISSFAVALYVTLVDGPAIAFYGSLVAMTVTYYGVLYWLDARAERTRPR